MKKPADRSAGLSVVATGSLMTVRPAESAGAGFENRSGADMEVREHRKRRNLRQMAGRVELAQAS